MLVLTRKINEAIVIGGNIRVTMTSIRNRHVRLAIDAPRGVPIVRGELLAPPPDDPRDERRALSGARDEGGPLPRLGSASRYR